MDTLNDFALQQENDGKEIVRLLGNLRKDSATRKTKKYLEERKNRIQEVYKRIQETHNRMVAIKIDTHNYFQTNYIEQLNKVYHDTLKYINECVDQTTVEDKLANKPEENMAKDYLTYKTEQEVRTQELEEILDEVESELGLNSSDKHAFYVKEIQEKWTEINKINIKIKIIEKEQKTPYSNNNYQQLRARYITVIGALENKIQEKTRQSTSLSNVKLPNIRIPVFDGKYEEWPTFQDIFRKVIHDNRSMSNVEKLHYLKTYVQGEAQKTIQHFEITESNYESAWRELKERYENKRRTVNKLINKILQLPTMSKESAEELKNIYNTVKECVEAIKMQGIDTGTWDPIIVCAVSNKWDAKTNEQFEGSLDNNFEMQSFDSVMKFILRRFQALEAAADTSMKSGHIATRKGTEQHQQGKSNCKYCNLAHNIYACTEFKKLSVEQRYNFAKERKLCFNCLNHSYEKKCFSQYKCKICGRNHNTILHNDEKKTPAVSTKKQVQNVSEKNKSQEKSQKFVSHAAYQDGTVVLATALIKVKNASNQIEFLRALIDQGSQASFITEEGASLLNLPREKIRAEITGLGDTKPKMSKQKIQVCCRPRTSSTYQLTTNLLILPKLTKNTPEHQICYNEKDWQNIVLADPTYYKPGPIDLILGAREYSEILVDGMKKFDNGLIAQNTQFGWIIFGASPFVKVNEIKLISMMTRTEDEEEISKFWEMEEVTTQRNLSKEEEECERWYETTTKRNSDGTYTVRIPFKNDIDLGQSRSRAMARLLQTENRLSKQKNNNTEYKDFMQTYADLGHMKEVAASDEGQGRYYIPHQAVIREESTTTKLRVVFDASCKTTNGKSLNEIMCVGPRIQQELCDILLRWRENKIAFSADIEKMYRQIKIHEEDQQFHRILWRCSTSDPIKEYQLQTVTYGTAAAPYLAIKTIQTLAKDEQHRFPEAAKIAMTNCYVDDVLAGANTVDEAIKIQNELIQMFKSGGFNLRKWSANNETILANVSQEMRDQQGVKLNESDVKKSLGIHWTPYDDKIRFKINIVTEKKLTKRTILSNAAKLFDPLGLLSPIIITAKIIIQELWLNKLAWDEPIPKNLADKWTKFYGQLKSVEDITIPRWTGQRKNTTEIHGFCDASEKAIGAVVYLKTKNEHGKTIIRLLAAKSKVAPIKAKTTLPRLELCAAVLLAKLLNRILTALEITNTRCYAWSDSMITLAWITGDASRWKTFVSNRVIEIQQLIQQTKWQYVNTKDNPADAISRGVEPEKLKKDSLWWEGPNWLIKKENEWPNKQNIEETKIEAKRCLHTQIKKHQEKIFEKFSSLTKATRVIAYCKRFILNCKKQAKYGPLTVKEIEDALNTIIVCEQNDSFPDEIKNLLHRTKQLPKQNVLASLHPFIDDKGVLRVGGRLKHALLKYDEKHPIIISGKSILAEMIIRQAHDRTIHGGNQQTLAYIRRKFWLTNGKKAVKRVINQCTTCIRYKAKTAEQLMGQLPAIRVTPASAFVNTGLDYAGPMMIRTTKGRGHKAYKGYIALFVCFTTKAIHLEVVSDMTSETFIAALKRFMARRGTCANLYSDNGTTFVGANKLLHNEINEMIRKSEIQDELSTLGTQWHFTPPSAPHFGGIWEAGVKSAKYHLKRIIGDTTLTFEEITTLVYQVEACLNSRPLCKLTEEINDVSILTPGHFLVGRELVTPTSPVVADDNMGLTGRWKLIQKMKKDFWNSWSTEYLNQLQQINKWKLEKQNLSVGDVVIIKEDNISVSKWPLAKITDVHKDKEDLVRVVSLRKAEGTMLKRPIHKLIPLVSEKEVQENVQNKKVNKLRFKSTHTRRSSSSTWRKVIIALLFILQLNKKVSGQSYHIEHPKPGLYIEHLGQARIDRGSFRIELEFKNSQLQADVEGVHKVINQTEELCYSTRDLAEEIEWKSLIDHLKQEEKKLEWIKKGVEKIVHKREKRGLWGTFLTSVFGVNDEVYRQIDELDKNQRELIQASSHQTKFMLQAISRFNDTEIRVVNKLNQFQIRLKEATRVVNNMQAWYSRVDRNKLEIHLLRVYEIAKNYIEEITHQYHMLLNVQLEKESIYEIISAAHIEEIIKTEATSRLPQHIEVLSRPIIKTEITQRNGSTFIYVYFVMAKITQFELVKANPVPLKIEKSQYWIFDVGTDIIAVDYNNQRYFKLSDWDLKNSVKIEKHAYVCSPTVLRSVENNPNCVIDELYHRSENTSCPVVANKMTGLIWKKLYTNNAWMFIAQKKTKIAITCNGVREETTVNTTGIIVISQNCVISTKRTILTPKRLQSLPVMAGYARPVAVNLTMSEKSSPRGNIRDEVEIEPFDDLKDLKLQEETLQEELDVTQWRHITHQSTLTSGITTIIIIAIIVLVGMIVKWILQRCKSKSQKRQRPAAQETEQGIELTPLNCIPEEASSFNIE